MRGVMTDTSSANPVQVKAAGPLGHAIGAGAARAARGRRGASAGRGGRGEGALRHGADGVFCDDTAGMVAAVAAETRWREAVSAG